MTRSWLCFGLLAAYGTGILADANAACSRTATAKTGDTCASVAAAYGLTVADFLRANPGLSVCALVGGSTYCVAADGSTATAPPPSPIPTTRAATSSPAQPTSSLTPSPDGSDGVCGGQYTCLGSVYGDCCSLNGYCGNSTDYCGEGCNPLYGRCGGGAAAGCTSGTTVTVTVGGVAATVTSYITKSQTQTVTKTVTAASNPTPSPVLSGTNKNCNKWYLVRINDRCQVIARTYGITTAQITAWNPSFDCYDIEELYGNYICVGIQSP